MARVVVEHTALINWLLTKPFFRAAATEFEEPQLHIKLCLLAVFACTLEEVV